MTATEQYQFNQTLISELRDLLAQDYQLLVRQRETIKSLKALFLRSGR